MDIIYSFSCRAGYFHYARLIRTATYSLRRSASLSQSIATKLESNHKWQQPMHYTEIALNVQFSYCHISLERSGSEHDLSGWLSSIPTEQALGFAFFPKQPRMKQL